MHAALSCFGRSFPTPAHFDIDCAAGHALFGLPTAFSESPPCPVWLPNDVGPLRNTYAVLFWRRPLGSLCLQSPYHLLRPYRVGKTSFDAMPIIGETEHIVLVRNKGRRIVDASLFSPALHGADCASLASHPAAGRRGIGQAERASESVGQAGRDAIESGSACYVQGFGDCDCLTLFDALRYVLSAGTTYPWAMLLFTQCG